MSRSLYAQLTRRFHPQAGRVNRREFLQATLAASAGLLVSCAPLTREIRPNGRKVVVLGAGFSGLACAHELANAGYAVTVFDARPRVGGRVLSFGDFVPGKNVEGGGELIGINHPAWMAYAKKFGLKFLKVTEDETVDQPLVLEGRRLDEKAAKALWEELDVAHKLLAADATPVNAAEPWRSANAAALDARSAGDWIAALNISALAKRAMAAELATNNGVEVARQSYLGNLAQIKGGGLEKYWTDSETHRCRGGNQQLAFKLAEALGAARLRLGVAVTEVRVKSDRVEIQLADGQIFEADEAVLAIPPSVWKKIRFTPELPATLSPQMGVNVKYLAAVKNRFWKKDRVGSNAFTDGMIGLTWEATDGQSDAGAAVLTVFSGAKGAETCRSRWQTERDRAYQTELEKLYPKFPENFVKSRFMDWPGDPWTGASYSFPAPGQVTTVGPVLHAGLGRLHFAGEHACYQFVGYMEGALHSGAALAKRLAVRDGFIKAA